MKNSEPESINQSSFYGVWQNSKGTLTIKYLKPGLVTIHTNTPQRRINGYGHIRGNEIIAIRWYEWNVDLSGADRHAYGTYWIDNNDVLHGQSFNSDGTPAYKNTFVRAN